MRLRFCWKTRWQSCRDLLLSTQPSRIYPDLLEDEDKFPSELSCAERAVSAPQSVTANLTAATAVVSFLYDLLIAGDLKTRYVTFSSKLISMRAEVVRQRPKPRKATAKAA